MGDGEHGRSRVLHAQGRARPAPCVWFRDERVRSAFQPQTGLRSSPTGGWTCSSPRARSSCTWSPAAVGVRRSRGRFEQLKAKLAAGACSTPRASGRCRHAHARSRSSLADGRRVARRVQRPGPALAAGAGRPRGLPGPGRGGAAEHRGCPPPPRTVDGPGCDRGSPDDAPGVTILARAAARWRTCGRSTTSASSGRSSRTVCPSCAGVGHETDVTLAGLRGGRAGAHAVCGHAELVVPDRLEAAGIVGHSRTAPRWPRAVALPRRPGRGGGASSPSRDSSHAPSSRTSRERVGLLLDRAARSSTTGCGARRRTWSGPGHGAHGP